MKTFPILFIFSVLLIGVLGTLVLVSATIQEEPQKIEENLLNDQITKTIKINIEDSVGSSDEIR